MLKPSFLYNLLKSHGITCNVGVPDSLLKDYCSYIYDQGEDIIAANEGGAIALATGYYLATADIALVYMQNSGFGNTVNPLTSLAAKEVYSIPMLLMIGWRGKPGSDDEPQHRLPGKTMEAQLKALEIPYSVLSKNDENARTQIEKAVSVMEKERIPYALLVAPDTFEQYKLKEKMISGRYALKREKALEILVGQMGKEQIVVSTTGKTSRELFELREKYNQGHGRDFLTVGSMGHASQIAMGIALNKPDRSVICIDGDGSVLMHMGSLAVIGKHKVGNLRHIIINNGAHESVGGQPTAGFSIDFQKIARGCGYKQTYRAENEKELKQILPEFLSAEGPSLLEIMTKVGSRENLGRPTIAPVDNKENFMKFLSDSNR